MDPHDFVRAFLACYFGFVAVHYTSTLMAAHARTGASHADVGQRGTTQYVAHNVFHIFRAAILVLCCSRVLFPGIDQYVLPLPGYGIATVELSGAALMLGSFALISFVHGFLGPDWRSGVPQSGPLRLIETGPYSVTRNPMFIGVVMGQLGFLLAFPSVFTLVCLVIGATVVIQQTRYEESELERVFGATYRAYCERTPRWLLRPGNRSDPTEPISDKS
jgi:protein-S-isoprenylcysteine O-methyltransferase Ste14